MTARFYDNEYQRQLKFNYEIKRFNKISRINNTLI